MGFVRSVAWETQTREAPEFALLDYKMREADKGKTHRVTVSSRSCLSSFRIGAGEKQGNSLRRTGWGLNMSGILCCLSGSLQLLLPP